VIYQRSRAIEQRLDEILKLISTGEHSTPSLAKAVAVSIPTMSRCITALRNRGHDIRSVCNSEGWRYVLGQSPSSGGSVQSVGSTPASLPTASV
jgi:biotin operon repressor